MKTECLVLGILSAVLAIGTPAVATLHTFDDFSSLRVDPELKGYLFDAGFEATFSGDDGSILTDLANGSLNALLLGTQIDHDYTAELTISFNQPVIELVMEFDSMHLTQQDQITVLIGTWTSYPASLSLSGQTLYSTAELINPGGSGIDDDLMATLTFGSPVSSVTFTCKRAFALDSITVNAIPEPTAITLLGLGGLALLRRRKRM